MKLIKKQLLALPPTPLPKGLRLPKNQSPDYIYTARAHGGILAIELYRPGGSLAFRVFCTGESWASYDTERETWGQATLEHIGQGPAGYWRANQLYPANKESAAAADSLLPEYKGEAADRVEGMQRAAQAKRERLALQKRREETEDVMAAWPGLPQGWEKRLENGPWDHSKYCFYRKTPRDSLGLAEQQFPYTGQCSACGESFGLPGHLGHTPGKPLDLGIYRCPCCGEWLHPKKYGLGRGSLGEGRYLLLATAQEGRAYLDLIYARREYQQPPFVTKASHCYRWLFDTVNNTAAMWGRACGGWRKMGQAGEPPGIAFAMDESVREAICATRLKYGLDLLEKNGVLRAGAALTRYPALELVDKIGSSRWARGVIWRGCFAKQAVNLKGKTMREALGLDKGELEKAKIQCETCFELFVFQALRREGKWYTQAQKKTVQAISEPKKFVKIAGLTGMAKALAYVEKQGRLAQRGANDIIGLWADYLEECRILQYGLADPYNQMPPDLLKAHGRTMQLVGDMQNEALNQQIAKRLPELEKYCWEADGLFIRPAGSVGELKAEGSALCHCVATYAQRYANGETVILLVRRQGEPEAPFVTVEYRGGKVVQAQAKGNQPPPQEAGLFLDKWREYLTKPHKTTKNHTAA